MVEKLPQINETQEERKKRVSKVIRLLQKKYPDAHCALNFSNAFELLVATILSAQCTDKRVNSVTPVLFKKYRSIQDYARAKPEVLAQEIRSTGFFSK